MLLLLVSLLSWLLLPLQDIVIMIAVIVVVVVIVGVYIVIVGVARTRYVGHAIPL